MRLKGFEIDVFQNVCLRRIFQIQWQDRINNKDELEMAKMKNLSEDVRRRRWNFIGHMRKGHDNDCRTAMMWVPEGRPKWGTPQTTCRRTADKERERAGWRCWREVSTHQLTELVGDSVLRPYLSLGEKTLVEG